MMLRALQLMNKVKLDGQSAILAYLTKTWLLTPTVSVTYFDYLLCACELLFLVCMSNLGSALIAHLVQTIPRFNIAKWAGFATEARSKFNMHIENFHRQLK